MGEEKRRLLLWFFSFLKYWKASAQRAAIFYSSISQGLANRSSHTYYNNIGLGDKKISMGIPEKITFVTMIRFGHYSSIWINLTAYHTAGINATSQLVCCHTQTVDNRVHSEDNEFWIYFTRVNNDNVHYL